MKKQTLWIIMALTMSAATGCSVTEEHGTPTDTEKKVAIKTSIETCTVISEQKQAKAPQLTENGSGNFANGDTFMLLSSTASGLTTTFDYQVGITNLYWKDILRNPQDHTIDFSACYPKQTHIDGKFSFDLETAEDKDLLWARISDVPIMTETPIELTFKHAMHRLVISYEAASSEVELDDPIQTVCTAKSTCQVDLISGTMDNSASRKAEFTDEGDKAVFLLIPQQTSDVTLRIGFGQNVQEFRLDELVNKYDSLEGGKQLNVKLKIKNGSIILDGSSIAGWGDQGTVEGEIII